MWGCSPLRTSKKTILNCQFHNFCVEVMVKNRTDKVTWRLITVNGSPYEKRKMEFIDELHMIMSKWDGPTVVGGGFNLVTDQKEKNRKVVNSKRTLCFNDWINMWDLIEIKNSSRSIT
jgi:hypothetical protein